VPIPEDKRRPEEELLAEFMADQPRILGALLDAVATGLRRLPEVRSQLKNLPRMADFALWAAACETAFWEASTFMKAYADNIAGAVEIILRFNTVATAVREFMAMQQPETTWTGTATDLLDLLGRVAGEKVTRTKFWPTDGARLSGRLRRVATFLRKVGIDINLDERTNQKRDITITVLPEKVAPADDPRPARASFDKRSGANGGADVDVISVSANAAASVDDEIISRLADAYQKEAERRYDRTGAVDFAELDARFLKRLTTAGPPELAEAVLARVKKMLSA
jgi:hypothetical protein